MRFYADLHIHSRFSRATSSRLSVEALAEAAVTKGIAVLGTGDFTHPAWLQEIEESLVEAEPGLYRLKGSGCPTRFMLTAEISTIYKQDGRVRKVHHVVAAPGLEQARRIASRLAGLGNILSDGRPILGITSRDLLEIVLESGEGTFLIPAHIWTPWFSVLGSKSGFDSIAECYLDLEPHVFAVETGLSSDPPMNWMVSGLDRYRLVSCSDAHSTDKLGREATVFDTSVDYFAMRRAMATGEGLAGTVEFFPEEGKYHLDGHRECGVVFDPAQTRELSCRCPVCGKGLTVGVLHRVEELADRPEGSMPVTAKPYHRIIPLSEILAEIMQVSSPTPKVMEACERICSRLGGELPLLVDADPGAIDGEAGPALAEAVRRMRAGEVRIDPGYDGRFGRIRVFADNERDLLFPPGCGGRRTRSRRTGAPRTRDLAAKDELASGPDGGVFALTQDQADAVSWREGALMVIAGPGTGKTRVLVERVKKLAGLGEGPILAVTFTTRAAREIVERLGAAPGHGPDRDGSCGAPHRAAGAMSVVCGTVQVDVCTFHALAARILREAGIFFEVADEDMLRGVASQAVSGDVGAWAQDIVYRQGAMKPLEPEQEALVRFLESRGIYTYEGLIEKAMAVVEEIPPAHGWEHVMVDEFQDVNPLQYAFLRRVSAQARSVMVIGDPHQAIYGFRGSNPKAFEDFERDHGGSVTIRLGHTHRFGRHIAAASAAIVSCEALIPRGDDDHPVRVVWTHTQPEFIARQIESLCGGLSHRGVSGASAEIPLSSMAVIVRTRNQALPIIKALEEASIPCDTAYALPLAQAKGVRERIALLLGEGYEGLLRTPRGGSAPDANTAREFLGCLSGSIRERIEKIENSAMFALPPLDADHALYRYARLFGDDTQGFVQFLALSRDDSGLGGERVHVITAHAAKGLEFECVFVAGLSRGMFPLAGADPEEERNLFYVAVTRARRLVYLVCPPQDESEFIRDIPQECKEEIQDGQREHKPRQMRLFE